MTRGKHSFKSCLMIIPPIVLWQEARWRMIGLMVQRWNPTFQFRGENPTAGAAGMQIQATSRQKRLFCKGNVANTEGGGQFFRNQIGKHKKDVAYGDNLPGKQGN